MKEIPIRIKNSDDNGSAGKTVNWYRGENNSHNFKIAKPQVLLELISFRIFLHRKKKKKYIISEKLENCVDSSALPRIINFFEKLLAVRRTIQNKEENSNKQDTFLLNIWKNLLLSH